MPKKNKKKDVVHDPNRPIPGALMNRQRNGSGTGDKCKNFPPTQTAMFSQLR
jgi:hypothetical protein